MVPGRQEGERCFSLPRQGEQVNSEDGLGKRSRGFVPCVGPPRPLHCPGSPGEGAGAPRSPRAAEAWPRHNSINLQRRCLCFCAEQTDREKKASASHLSQMEAEGKAAKPEELTKGDRRSLGGCLWSSPPHSQLAARTGPGSGQRAEGGRQKVRVGSWVVPG